MEIVMFSFEIKPSEDTLGWFLGLIYETELETGNKILLHCALASCEKDLMDWSQEEMMYF